MLQRYQSSSSPNTRLPDGALACGVDLGGTKIAVALATRSGIITAREVIRNYRTLSENGIIARIADCVTALTGQGGQKPGESGPDELVGVAVGTAGHVDYERGILISNSNLSGFVNYPIAARMSEALGRPVVVDNDTNCQAYAEYLFGAGRGYENVAFVTVSTGLGAGFVLAGRLYRGFTGTAGEIGHTIVNPAGTIRCGCGNYGCLMAHASGLSLPAVVREIASRTGLETSLDLGATDDTSITGEMVKERLDAGDPLFTAVVREYADYLGIGLHNMVQTMNPGVIVVGGGLTEWGGAYLERATEVFRRNSSVTLNELPEVRLSELGQDAAVIGATALAFEAGTGNE